MHSICFLKTFAQCWSMAVLPIQKITIQDNQVVDLIQDHSAESQRAQANMDIFPKSLEKNLEHLISVYFMSDSFKTNVG